MVTVQDAPETVSHPVHPLKKDQQRRCRGERHHRAAVIGAEQVEPQLIPLGLEVTVPLPMPDLLTVRMKRRRVKVGITDLDAFIVRLQIACVRRIASAPVVEPGPGGRRRRERQCRAGAVGGRAGVVSRATVESRGIRGHVAVAGARLVHGERRLLKAAVTHFAAFMVTVQVVPETASHLLHP